ncbi:hypothetical protein [Sphingopyxis sp.]|uniref:hypothetical protein n=1 Tax=Sphingopyxis sp. TaxID=1908224 RepID=UPI002B46F1F2|nr:hypothetical protein [Sphingopyxis sp.]HJS11688.1 hypothetical protein [Sphingopyxis sp.]
MHPFPAPADLNFLIGKEIGQVCLDPNSVQILFWNGGRVHIEHDLEHVAENRNRYLYDCTAHMGPPLLLHRLVAKVVTSLDVTPFRLTLNLNDGQKLILHSEEGPYECGQIWSADDPAEGYIIY